MFRRSSLLLLAVVLVGSSRAHAEEQSFAKVATKVNTKMVKLFGAGGIKGLPHYGTGILISADGYILTSANHLLDSNNVRVHLADGRRYESVKRVAVNAVLDLAILKISPKDKEDLTDLPFFDIAEASKRPQAQAGDWVLAFSNQFEIATKDEPMSVQRGTIAAIGQLPLRRGAHDATLEIPVYTIDAITNNPGAAGGAVTTRKGELVAVVGKELRNKLTDTWINYAIPVDEKVGNFVKDVMAGKYQETTPLKQHGPGCSHGIVFVPDVVERTPPLVDAVEPDSPAAAGGLKVGDTIWLVDGQRAGSIKEFKDLVDFRLAPATKVRLEVRRQGETSLMTVDITLGEPKKKPVKDPKKEG